MSDADRPPVSACELPDDRGPARSPSGSKVVRFREGFEWEGVEPRAYKDPAAHWRGVARHALIGEAGETAPFHVRYFEIAPGGHSTHETHAHEHVMVPVRGRGLAILGGRRVEVGFGDVIYVAPDDPHQFKNPTEEPFGFLCIVPARRDRPQPVGGDSP